jgi:hypothetical protein
VALPATTTIWHNDASIAGRSTPSKKNPGQYDRDAVQDRASYLLSMQRLGIIFLSIGSRPQTMTALVEIVHVH